VEKGPTIALVAGEDSGDQLGAPLISDLKSRIPGCRLVGIGGERMRAAGMECWWDCSELAHFGLFEVLKHLGRIWKLRRQLLQKILQSKPDVFIGIDAPDFNLGLERRLKEAGIPTVHYVSPTVWAWRAWRIPRIRRATDLVLCLFPFEPEFLGEHDIPAAYVGHPLADQIEPVADPGPARHALGIEGENPVFALLPGSRLGEVERLADPMLGAARLLRTQYPSARFVAALANPRVAVSFRERLGNSDGPEVVMIEGRVREVIAAADVVLCASGTVTLETMLIDRPMVVSYRLSSATYFLARAINLVKAKRFSLPNILAGDDLVPELTQHLATAENIAREAAAWLSDEERRKSLSETFRRIHDTLRCDASSRAAAEVAKLLGRA
jgi:lipid-A-disaccharide synthase